MAHEQLDALLDLGVNFIDTAEMMLGATVFSRFWSYRAFVLLVNFFFRVFQELKNFKDPSSYFIAFNKVTHFFTWFHLLLFILFPSLHPSIAVEVSGALRRWPGDGEVDRYLAVQVAEGGQSATGEVPGLRWSHGDGAGVLGLVMGNVYPMGPGQALEVFGQKIWSEASRRVDFD